MGKKFRSSPTLPRSFGKLIDIGANLSHIPFLEKETLDQVFHNARQCEISHIIVTGTSLASSRSAIDLCREERKGGLGPSLFCTVGGYYQSGNIKY